MKNNRFKDNAYSLIEILITVIIVGVIASLAFANYGIIIERSVAKEGEQILLSYYSQAHAIHLEYPTLSCLGIGGKLSQASRPPTNFNGAEISCFGVPPNPQMIPMQLIIERKGSPYKLIIDTAVAVRPWEVKCITPTAGYCVKLGYLEVPSPGDSDPL